MGTTDAIGIVPPEGYGRRRDGGTIAGMEHRAHFIREWRQHRHMTQDQLAERIGMNRAYLSKIESGKRRYDQPFLEAAAVALQCQPADLIMRNPTDPEGIWSLWETLRPTERRQVIEVAKAIHRAAEPVE